MAFISEEETSSLRDPPSRATYRSFDELYERSRVSMVRLASFLVASRSEGEDLTHDAFLEAVAGPNG